MLSQCFVENSRQIGKLAQLLLRDSLRSTNSLDFLKETILLNKQGNNGRWQIELITPVDMLNYMKCVGPVALDPWQVRKWPIQSSPE